MTVLPLAHTPRGSSRSFAAPTDLAVRPSAAVTAAAGRRGRASAAPPLGRRLGVAVRAAYVQSPDVLPQPPMARRDTWLRIARVHNMAPSIVLVLLGAWAGTGRSVAALHSAAVWAVSLMSAGVAVASVVINDYFDLRVDRVNAPHKPLPSGALAPDAALLFSCAAYVAVLVAACLLEPPAVRRIVAYSAAATLLYTPLLKRLTGVKNATVASVVALAPLAGALAAGAGEAGLVRLAPATALAFGGVMFREVVMDLNDEEGDRAAGVCTLPVVAGKRAALAAALACGLAGCGAAAWLVVTRGGCAAAATGAAAAAWTTAARLGVLGWAALRLCALAWRVSRSGFQPCVAGAAVDACLRPIGLGMVLLAALA